MYTTAANSVQVVSFFLSYLIASTHMVMMLKFSLVRRAACILWISHHVLQGNTLYYELISGFPYEKLWDPGGFRSSVWNCQWQVVRVNCKGRVGAVHPMKQRLPLKARTETWPSSCEVLPIRRHGKCLLYVQPFLAMGFFRTQLGNNVLFLQPSLLWDLDILLIQRALCSTRPQVHIPVSRPANASFSFMLVLGHECIPVQPTRDALHLQQAKSTFLQASAGSQFIAYSSLIACDLLHWNIAWPLYKAGKICSSTTVRCESYLEKINTALQPFSTRTIQIFLVNWSTSYHAGNYGYQHLTPGTGSVVPSEFIASIAMRIYSLEFYQGKLSWDPGIWALLFVLDFSPKLKHDGNLYPTSSVPANFNMVTYLHCRGPRATDESDCLAPMQLIVSHASRNHGCYPQALSFFNKAHANQEYYPTVLRDKVPISHTSCIGVCNFNLVRVCLNYDTHYDLREALNHEVPWDPGSLTWHWLEVKPKVKEGEC
jgi:hypothetical protein